MTGILINRLNMCINLSGRRLKEEHEAEMISMRVVDRTQESTRLEPMMATTVATIPSKAAIVWSVRTTKSTSAIMENINSMGYNNLHSNR